MTRTIAAGLLAVALVGCQSKLTDSRTVTVDSGKTVTLTIPAPTYDQTVSYSFKADGGEINVYVCDAANVSAVESAADGGRDSDKALAVKKKATDVEFDLKVKGKTETAVIISSASTKKVTVKVNIKGK